MECGACHAEVEFEIALRGIAKNDLLTNCRNDRLAIAAD